MAIVFCFVFLVVCVCDSFDSLIFVNVIIIIITIIIIIMKKMYYGSYRSVTSNQTTTTTMLRVFVNLQKPASLVLFVTTIWIGDEQKGGRPTQTVVQEDAKRKKEKEASCGFVK